MDDGSPTLEVGFAIDMAGSFTELARLAEVMDSTEAKIVRDATSIERATGGMVNIGPAVASISTFSNAATRAERDVRREKAATERSIEGLIKQIDRETAAVGRTRAEQRAARVEELAVTAARQGNTEAADRLLASTRALKAAQDALAEDRLAAETKAAAEALREKERAEAAVIAQLRERANLEAALDRINGSDRPRAKDAGATYSALAAREAAAEAREKDLAAAATKRLADEHARLATLVRASHDAQVADAAAAERLRASTDPLYAATSRLNAEIAESTRLYYAGATAPAEYARQQQVLADRLREVERAHETAGTGIRKVGGAARLSSGDMLNLGYQINDVIVSLVSGQKPFTVFAQQGAQIGQIAASSGVGFMGMARSVGALLLPFAPLIATIGVAAGGFLLFDRAVSKGIDTKAMVDSLGLTRDEIKRLKNTSIDTGDVVKATFQVMAQRVGLDLKSMTGYFSKALDFMTTAGRVTLAALYSQFVGTFRAIGAIVRGVFARKGIGEILADVGDSYKGAFKEANTEMIRFGEDVTKQLKSNKLADLTKQANELKKDRTPEKPKTDRHAESLQREAKATEAQIRNLYALAKAYGVSGGAALIAEARVKAETAAIKRRGDVEAFVDRQVRLSIAQRVSDAAKSTATLRDQAAAQEIVNKAVAAGNVPGALANELLQDRLADIPLLDAIQAAQARAEESRKQGLVGREAEMTAAVEAATAALEDQRDARNRLSDAERKARLIAATRANENRLAELREELRLVGATEAVRARSLAILRATQQAEADGHAGPDAKKLIDQAGEIAGAEYQVRLQTDALNNSLSYQADLLDVVASNMREAGQGMADAFGDAGRSLGDLASTFTSFLADQRRLTDVYEEQMRVAAQNTDVESRLAAERQASTIYSLRSSALQIDAYGDMTAAAKSFFKEGTSGYQALQKAEQVFRAIQFAMSVRAIAQDAIETGSSLAKSAARTAANAVEAVTKAISSLPFPLNLAAGAATAAALASIGVAIGGSFGGGGSKPAPSNTGTGTVLGDPAAQSQSIARSIDALKQVDTLMLAQSREMAASLRSIDAQIGGFTAQILKAGDINANAGADLGFKGNAIGGILSATSSVLSKIPVIGGVFGAISGFINSLFGSTSKVVGNGLFGGPQALGSILGSGFDASYYSDIEKTSKFLGIKTGTSYSTKYSDADPALEQQFTLILRSFSDAIGAAAGPLGLATADIQSRLAGFVVDIGKIDLKGLTGEQIQEKLAAVFGAAADRMAEAAIPGLSRFQKAGEGLFETVIRVASTVETVTYALDQMGGSAASLSIDAKMGLASQFESLSDLQSAVSGYLDAFFTPAERAQAQAAQMGQVFGSLGLAMPSTIAGFRQLVDAQDLSTAAGQETYATLLQLAPAFADLQAALNGAKSAADVLAEREDLQRRLLERQGNTAALRALDLAKLDASNRALQEQIWAIEDAQEAARAADELRQAWQSVGDSIRDEVARIRGIASDGQGGGFALAQGRFNAAVLAAQAGDQKAAESLPGLSQALLTSAEAVATSQQELARIRAATAATLDSVAGWIDVNPGATAPASTKEQLLTAIAANTAANTPAAANDDTAAEIRALREEVAAMRADNNSGHAATAGNTGRLAKKLDDVTAASGGDAISVQAA